jgi:hypothetical protein
MTAFDKGDTIVATVTSQGLKAGNAYKVVGVHSTSFLTGILTSYSVVPPDEKKKDKEPRTIFNLHLLAYRTETGNEHPTT